MALTIWRIALSDANWAEELWPVLDSAEQNRARRFLCAALKRRYIIAHGALRLILANISHRSTADLQFIINPWGKPYLEAGNVVFNLSHSRDLALCAVASAGEIGVDIESFRPAEPSERLALARRFFHSEEYYSLSMVTEAAQNAAFIRYWTRKEAYIKAKGLGLSLPLHQFHINFTGAPALISSEYCPADVGKYRLWEISVPLGYWASLAYAGADDGELIYCDWTPELS